MYKRNRLHPHLMAAKTVIGFLATSPNFHSSRGMDPGNLNPGLHLAMTATSAHVFAATELLDDNLLVPELLDDLPRHAGTLNERGANGGASFARDQEDLREDDLFAARARAPIEYKLISRADA